MVDVTTDGVKHAFSAHTGMGWQDFQERAQGHFNMAHDDVQLGYCLSGKQRCMIWPLSCESEWNNAMKKMGEKAKAARTCVAAMELVNMVSDALLTIKKYSS